MNRWSVLLFVFLLAMTGCESETETLLQESAESSERENGNDKEEGTFRAVFSVGSGEEESRAVDGQSQRVQSLKYILYKRVGDSYVYDSEKDVIVYESIKGHSWPLKDVITEELTNGDYKVVFIGNADPKLFFGQTDAILSNYKGDYREARINMPLAGPCSFTDYNMFYLAEADFSNLNPTVNDILLRRLVSQNVFKRETINDNAMISSLVDNLAKQIKESQLTTDIVRGLLRSTLLDPINKALGGILGNVLGGVTAVVDRVVALLLGDVVDMLNTILLQELTTRIEASLKGEGGGGGLLGLGYVLNPWTLVDYVDATVDIPSAVTFDRIPVSYIRDVKYSGLKMDKTDKNECSFSMITLNGDVSLKKAEVDYENNEFLAPILANLDEKLLAGLLINLETPLSYRSNSNLEYTTTYDLLDISLGNMPSEEDKDKYLNLTASLSDILDAGALTEAILGDNILSGILGALVESIIDPLLSALGDIVLSLKIELPNLGINNIQLDGRWGATYVSDGTVVDNVVGIK